MVDSVDLLIGGLVMMILFLLFWVGVVALVVYLVRRWRRDPTWPGALAAKLSHPTDASAQEVLDRRLALGEIEPDEYRRRSDALNVQAPANGQPDVRKPPSEAPDDESETADEPQSVDVTISPR